MDRRTDLTLFAGFHVAKLVSAGGTLPPKMTYDDVHDLIEEYCTVFRPIDPEHYAAKLERAMTHFIKQAAPGLEEELYPKLLEFALKEVDRHSTRLWVKSYTLRCLTSISNAERKAKFRSRRS